MRIHNESPDEPVLVRPDMGVLMPRWGVAGLCLALGLFITDAPAWAWVLAGGGWVLGLALATILTRALSAGASAAPLTRPDPLGAPDAAPEVAEQPDPAREAEQEALRYALSHDLRAPLRVIDGFTRIVKEDYGKHLDRLGQDHLDRVLAASARMSGMIDAILAQAQLAGEALACQRVDVSAMVADVAAEQSAVFNAGASVKWVIQPGLCAQADATLLHRVLENLLGNALKYSAKVAAPRIEFGCTPATNPPVFFVRDNGAGFDMQHADKLFGMFQRLHSAKEFEGNGVGLAGVHQIIRRHGGRVWAEAQPGQGACFYFTLTGRLDSEA